MSVSFDMVGFLKSRWPTPTHLHNFLRAYGVADLKAQAYFKQFRRGSIPSDQFALMLALIELETGTPPSLAAFLKT